VALLFVVVGSVVGVGVGLGGVDVVDDSVVTVLVGSDVVVALLVSGDGDLLVVSSLVGGGVGDEAPLSSFDSSPIIL